MMVSLDLNDIGAHVRHSIEATFVEANAAPSTTLASVYGAFNITAAALIDELHATSAQDDTVDRVAVLKAERSIITACCQRAAELIAQSADTGGGA